MILKKCINGSMILIDNVTEAHVYSENGVPFIYIHRGNDGETHMLSDPAYLLNDEGKTIERLPCARVMPDKKVD